jgi:hypothetical protein
MKNVIETRGANGEMHRFDFGLYARIRAAKNAESCALPLGQGLLEKHPLVGRRFRLKGSSKTHRITRIKKMWHQGYFLAAFIETPGADPSLQLVENISSMSDVIVPRITQFQREVSWIPEMSDRS